MKIVDGFALCLFILLLIGAIVANQLTKED